MSEAATSRTTTRPRVAHAVMQGEPPALFPFIVERTFDDDSYVVFVPSANEVEWVIADRRARKSLPVDHVPTFTAVQMRPLEDGE
jgi:hypothetical protein